MPNMLRPIRVVASLLWLALLATPGHAQDQSQDPAQPQPQPSLADVARQARKDKEKNAAKPKTDKFRRPYVHAEIAGGMLGFRTLHLTCAALRDYFYCPHRNHNQDSHTLYDVLRIPHNASPGDLRLAFRLRELELLTTTIAKAASSAEGGCPDQCRRCAPSQTMPGKRSSCSYTALPEAPALT